MPNRSIDPLFQLIKTLEKSEKRNFKLYVTRNTSSDNLKIIELFDTLDKLTEYDEAVLLKKTPGIKKQQLSNLKAHLYKSILSSLRLIKDDQNIDIQLHEQMGHARVLYNKGLYHQSLKILDKVKEQAYVYHQDSILTQVISLEKKIETLHITRNIQDKADHLAAEAISVHDRRKIITQLSNLALQLYSWYVKNGHARNEKDEVGVKEFFRTHLPANAHEQTGFYERLYLCQSYVWFAFHQAEVTQFIMGKQVNQPGIRLQINLKINLVIDYTL